MRKDGWDFLLGVFVGLTAVRPAVRCQVGTDDVGCIGAFSRS